MKAEAPEKIYVVIDPVWGSMSVNYNRNDTNNIEYIRADAFIDNAAEWIKDNGSRYIDIVNGQLVLKKGIIKDFKNYMKGE